MTQGIVSSLNITLARLSSIENNFSALEGMTNALNSSGVVKTVQALNREGITPIQTNKDFKTILDEKMAENKESENNVPENKSIINELSKNDILNAFKEDNENLEEETLPIEGIDLNLKDKISLDGKSADINNIIETLSDKYNVDSNFIKAIIQQESGFNTNAKSKKGAMGLMQLMPATAKSLGIKDAYNPYENIEGGVKYFKGLLDRFNNDEKLALAAYNAGPNTVKRYGGIPPYKETQNYVNSIMSAYDKMKGASL